MPALLLHVKFILHLFLLAYRWLPTSSSSSLSSAELPQTYALISCSKPSTIVDTVLSNVTCRDFVERVYRSETFYANFLQDELRNSGVRVGLWQRSRGKLDGWAGIDLAEPHGPFLGAPETREVRTTHQTAITRHIARATKRQLIKSWKDGSVVLDEVNIVEGVPFADAFVIYQRLVISPQSLTDTQIRGQVAIGFRRNILLARQITKGAEAECKDFHSRLILCALRQEFSDLNMKISTAQVNTTKAIKNGIIFRLIQGMFFTIAAIRIRGIASFAKSAFDSVAFSISRTPA